MSLLLNILSRLVKTFLPRSQRLFNFMAADDTTLMAESEEELKSLLMKVKKESEKVGLKFRKLRSWHLVPSLHGK